MGTVHESFLSQLSDNTGMLVRMLLAAPPTDVATLRTEVGDYLEHVRTVAKDLATVDVRLAEYTATGCAVLLDDLERTDNAAHHRVTQAACRYFVHTHDFDSDTHSPTGFVSDAKVVDAALATCGLTRPAV